jgi:hypothetical protein
MELLMEKEHLEQIAASVAEQLDKNRHIDRDTHRKHHEFIDTVIMETNRRRNFWEQIRKQVAGWGIIMVISGIGYAVWQWFDHFVHKG